MLTYQQATVILAKSKGSKKLENNTYLERIDYDTIGVKLHATYVVRIHANGTFTLHSGGWQMVTTKDRINGYSPVRVHAKKRVWYVGDTRFEEGMRVDSNGKIV